MCNIDNPTARTETPFIERTVWNYPEAMRVMKYVNKFNRGVTRVQEMLKENGNPPAEFDVNTITAFRVNVHATNESDLANNPKSGHKSGHKSELFGNSIPNFSATSLRTFQFLAFIYILACPDPFI